MKRWTNKEIKVLKKVFPSEKYNRKKICSFLPERTLEAILKKAKKIGLKRGKYWTDYEVEILKKIYPNNKFTKNEIIKFLPGRTFKAIQYKAGEIGIKSGKKESREYRLKSSRSKQKYRINEYYFDNIDSEDKAYWLGFILADGCVHKNTLQIGLQLIDKLHLEKFKKSIESTHKIVDEKKRPVSTISINNFYMVSRLKELGIMERKSKIAKPLNCIPEEFERDFWRGMVDGDGCVKLSTYKTGSGNYSNNRPVLGLAGTKKICNGFKHFCLKYIDSKRNVCKNSTAWRFELDHIKAVEISKILYEGSCIYMNRKYDEYLKIINRGTKKGN